jgi:hypothetical protein
MDISKYLLSEYSKEYGADTNITYIYIYIYISNMADTKIKTRYFQYKLQNQI